MDEPSEERPPIAVAMEWVSKMTTVALEMVLPGFGGAWLDRRLGTSYLAFVGFAVGLVCGVWHLLKMVGASKPPQRQPPKDSSSSQDPRQ